MRFWSRIPARLGNKNEILWPLFASSFDRFIYGMKWPNANHGNITIWSFVSSMDFPIVRESCTLKMLYYSCVFVIFIMKNRLTNIIVFIGYVPQSWHFDRTFKLQIIKPTTTQYTWFKLILNPKIKPTTQFHKNCLTFSELIFKLVYTLKKKLIVGYNKKN